MGDEVRNTLKKQERLSSGISLSRLKFRFNWKQKKCKPYWSPSGTSDFIRYCFFTGNGLTFNRIVVSVPKRNFKRAVKRNLFKRRIREAYRTSKTLLPVSAENGGTDILFIYNTKELKDFQAVTTAVRAALTNIAAKVAVPAANPISETATEE